MGDVELAQQGNIEKTGWLFKWTNYLKRYQPRWFVLSKGLLSYYRIESSGSKLPIRRKRRAARASENPAEMSHTCRGTISLHGALIHTVDACTFVVSNGGTQTFHIKAETEKERQQWVTALELAKAKAIQSVESEEEEEEEKVDYRDNETEKEPTTTGKELAEKLEDLQACNELISKKGELLTRAVTDFERLKTMDPSSPELAAKLKVVSERAVLFRVSANAMMTKSSEYLQLAQQQEPKWKKMLQHERDQKARVEKMVEQLARQHSHLEEVASHVIPNFNATAHRTSNPLVNASPSEDDEDNTEFYDAQESSQHSLNNVGLGKGSLGSLERGRTASQGSDDGSSSEGGDPVALSSDDPTASNYRIVTDNSIHTNELENTWYTNNNGNGSGSGLSRRKRRTTVPDKPNYPLNLWSIMKNCIGKELSKIPMPVNFSEPLSMLQRLTEDYEYADILDRAAECTDKFEQMAYVAAFTISSYSTTAARTGKPFNPLLGETYECDRTDDLGWKAISEQVSHHPPMVAQHCEGRKWRCWQEFTMASKFRGKYLQVIPLGTAHLEFLNGSQHYTWRKVTTTVHNIIVGKLWVDQSGDMDIVNHTDSIKCHLKYIPYSYFARDGQRKVKGVVMDANKEVKWVVQGNWDSKIEIAQVLSTSGTPENPVYKTGPYRVAWKRRMPQFVKQNFSEECEKFYSFTELACQLNEPEEGVAPTDSRHRPDQRLMESGLWDEANTMKLKLEEKQRSVRRAREHEAEEAAARGLPVETYEPLWFKKQHDPYTDSLCYVYADEYWDCKNMADWSRCPSIFTEE